MQVSPLDLYFLFLNAFEPICIKQCSFYICVFHIQQDVYWPFMWGFNKSSAPYQTGLMYFMAGFCF